jgi:integrase
MNLRSRKRPEEKGEITMGNERKYLGRGIFQEGDAFRIILYINGKRYIERTLKQAILMRAKRLIEIKEGKYFLNLNKKQKLFSELMAEYLEHSKASKRSYKRDITSSKRLIRNFGKYPLDQILPSMIETYRTKRQKEPSYRAIKTAPATINREMALLKTVLNRAVDDGLLDRNPMKKIKMMKENNARDRVLTPEEFHKLFVCSPPHLRPIIFLAYNTAMCITEILTLTWDRVDLKKREITLRDEDTKKRPRKVPMSDIVLAMFRSLPRSLIHPQVFLRHGNPVKSIREAFNAAVKRTGLDALWFHDLRHSAITNMRKAGVPDRVIMTISGHKTLWMLHRYDKIDMDDMLEAVNKTATSTATKPQEGENKDNQLWR